MAGPLLKISRRYCADYCPGDLRFHGRQQILGVSSTLAGSRPTTARPLFSVRQRDALTVSSLSFASLSQQRDFVQAIRQVIHTPGVIEQSAKAAGPVVLRQLPEFVECLSRMSFGNQRGRSFVSFAIGKTRKPHEHGRASSHGQERESISMRSVTNEASTEITASQMRLTRAQRKSENPLPLVCRDGRSLRPTISLLSIPTGARTGCSS